MELLNGEETSLFRIRLVAETLATPFSRFGALSSGCPVAAAFIWMLLAKGADTPNQSSGMTVHAPKLLTPEEFASLIEVAVTSPNPAIPAPHLSKLITLGYVVVTAKGPVVTGDGLIRITESE
jgi:hypothetical protein